MSGDHITLTGIRASGFHGVLDFEKTHPQDFLVDVIIYFDTARAARTDNITDTVDYGQIAHIIGSIIHGEHCNLIETLAERIAIRLLQRPLIYAITVTVHKPFAPIDIPHEDVSVTITRTISSLNDLKKGEEKGEEIFSSSSYGSSIFQDENSIGGASSESTLSESASCAKNEKESNGCTDSCQKIVSREENEENSRGEEKREDKESLSSSRTCEVCKNCAKDNEDPNSEKKQPVLHHVVLSLGGNQGDVRKAMLAAMATIDGLPGTQITGISPLYRTTPWGMDEKTPCFLNAVVQVDTILEPEVVLKTLQTLEKEAGRTHAKNEHWASRPLDIDIIDWDGVVNLNPFLRLPHPRTWQRAFVLAPWLDIDPDAYLAGPHGGSVKDLLMKCPDRDSVHRISDTWIIGESAKTYDKSVG